MPILERELDLYPADVLDREPAGEEEAWWAMYTRSRREKMLMRKLRDLGIGHYAPVIERRYRSPGGRTRTTFLPLFANYVFVRGDQQARYESVSTGCVSQCVAVAEPEQLVGDLRQIRRLIETGAPLTPEDRLEPGDRVRVKNGPFAGFEGLVIQRAGQRRLVVDVRFMNQGASVKLEDCQLEFLGR